VDCICRPHRTLTHARCALAAIALLCLAPAVRSQAAIGWGAGPATTIDTTAPILALDPVPANLILRGGQQLAFHWTTGDSHPGTAPNDFTAEVQDAGAPLESLSYLATPTNAEWIWTAPEMQSGYLGLLVTCRDAFGNTTTAHSGDFSIVLSSSGAPGAGLPGTPILEGNRPNPCNPGTMIRFSLPRAQTARLDLFAADGTRVRALADGDFTAGAHDVFWDGRDDRGRDVASGTYLLRLAADGMQQVHKLALVR
jgi:hypothetical protein